MNEPAGLDDDALRAIVEAAPDGIIVADEHGRIVLANRRASELFGWDRAELDQRSVDDLLPTRLQDAHHAHRDRYAVEPRTRPMGAGLTLYAQRADGSEFPVEISLSPLTTDTGLRVVAVVRDVTERVDADARLRRAEQHVRVVEDRERIARDLHDVVIQKLFAAGMTVQGVVARSSDPDQAHRLSGVVDDLDETIREIRSAIFELQADARDAGGIRAEILRVVDDERVALANEPHIRFNGPVDSISERVGAELLPVLREALSNVARHAGASAVEVSVDCGADIVLTVSDDGCGLPETVGSGNGIANLVRRAEKLGGQCVVASRSEGGTRLVWQVPRTA